MKNRSFLRIAVWLTPFFTLVMVITASTALAQQLEVSVEGGNVCYLAGSGQAGCFNAKGPTFDFKDETREILSIAQTTLKNGGNFTCFYEKTIDGTIQKVCESSGLPFKSQPTQVESGASGRLKIFAGASNQLCFLEGENAYCNFYGRGYYPEIEQFLSLELKGLKEWLDHGGRPLLISGIVSFGKPFNTTCYLSQKDYNSDLLCVDVEYYSKTDDRGRKYFHEEYDNHYFSRRPDLEKPELVTSLAVLQSPRIGAKDEVESLQGYYRYCVIENAKLRCEGLDYHLVPTPSYPPFFGKNSAYFKRMPKLKLPNQVTIAYDHMCVLDTEGLKCWGPKRNFLIKDFKGPVQIKSGKDFTCAMDIENLRCWNGMGQMIKEILFGRPRT